MEKNTAYNLLFDAKFLKLFQNIKMILETIPKPDCSWDWQINPLLSYFKKNPLRWNEHVGNSFLAPNWLDSSYQDIYSVRKHEDFTGEDYSIISYFYIQFQNHCDG